MKIEDLEISPETRELARQAVERNEAEKRALAAMSPEERAAYIQAWAKGLAEQSVEIGERGVGCACCDPGVKAKIKREWEPMNRQTLKPADDFKLSCQCGTLLYVGKKHPGYSAIICPKCKATSSVPKRQPDAPPVMPAPADVMPADPVKFQA